MFTNFVQYLVYSLMGLDASKYLFMVKAEWTLNRFQALIDLGGGFMICSGFIAVMLFIGSKIDEVYNANA